MHNIFKHKEKFQVLLIGLFFLFGPLSANSNDSIIGQLGQSLLEQHGRELYNKEYGERPPGWDRWDEDGWRRDRGEHRGWERRKHKGWYKEKHHPHPHHKHHKHHHHHKHHKHHQPHKHHQHHKHKGNDWKGGDWGGHKGSGKWGK